MEGGTNTYTYTHIHIYTYMHIYIYTCIGRAAQVTRCVFWFICNSEPKSMKSYAIRINPKPHFRCKNNKKRKTRKTHKFELLVSVSHSTLNKSRKTKPTKTKSTKTQNKKHKRNLRAIWAGIYWILLLRFWFCTFWFGLVKYASCF